MSEEAGQALRILVVDDEKAIRTFLKTALSAQGHAVFEAATAYEALNTAVSVHPDVVLLDLGLPDKDGLEIIQGLRQRIQAPVIILSVRGSETEKIRALDQGADDYVTKPFNIGELSARLRAVVRRLNVSSQGPIFSSAHMTVDFTKRLVTVKEKVVHLSPIEYDMLKLFILNAGVVLTHRRILREIWNKTEDFQGAGHLLRVTVSNLRNKIELKPERPVFILTEPGIGYRFCVSPS